jgi:hypothetical protein
MKFGKFKSVDEFIKSYQIAEKIEFLKEVHSSSRSLQPALIRNGKDRALAEVNAVVREHQEDDTDGDKHIHLVIDVVKIISASPVILSDVSNCLDKNLPVFVSVRYGDRMGLESPITEGIDPESNLHLKGEWIPADKAYSHGGEKMSVLHFTHHPIGFICTVKECYE